MRFRHRPLILGLMVAFICFIGLSCFLSGKANASETGRQANIVVTIDPPTANHQHSSLEVELVRDKDQTVLARTTLNKENQWKTPLVSHMSLDILDLSHLGADLKGHLTLRFADKMVEKDWQIQAVRYTEGTYTFTLTRKTTSVTPVNPKPSTPTPGTIPSGELYISKTVTGTNVANVYFNMSVHLTNATHALNGRQVTLSTYDRNNKPLGSRNVTLNQNARVDLRLRAGDNTLIKGLPEHTAYTLQEGATRDYQTSYFLNGEGLTTQKAVGTIKINQRTFIEVRNHYQSTASKPATSSNSTTSKKLPKTGLPVAAWPMLLVTAGILLRKK